MLVKLHQLLGRLQKLLVLATTYDVTLEAGDLIILNLELRHIDCE